MRLLVTLAKSPSFATVVTLLAVFVGFWGSVYGEEIRQSFPLTLFGPWTGFSWTAVGFWLGLAAFAFLFFLRQKSDDESRRELANGAERIRELVQTLPPREFRSAFRDGAHSIRLALDALAPRQPRGAIAAKELAEMIRRLLDRIVRLGLIADDRPETILGANIMTYSPWPATSKDAADELRRDLRFTPDDLDLSSLDGVLTLREDLSCRSDTKSEPDDRVSKFALPIPTQKRTGSGRWRLLPGGPMAFAERAVRGYVDSRTLGEWCRTEGDFRSSSVEDLETYFRKGNGEYIRSFVSVPLFYSDDCIGVLNIHSNATNFLAQASERLTIFEAMLSPVFLDLGDLLRLWLEAMQNERNEEGPSIDEGAK